MFLPGVEGRLENGVAGPCRTAGSSQGCPLGVHSSAMQEMNQISFFMSETKHPSSENLLNDIPLSYPEGLE
jgi:hypothetical protein